MAAAIGGKYSTRNGKVGALMVIVQTQVDRAAPRAVFPAKAGIQERK